MYCKKCGSRLDAHAKFCSSCGAKHEEKKAAEEPKTQMSDLLRRAKSGESKAIEKLYQMTYAQGYSVAVQIVKNEQDACDLLQDAYITAFQKLDTLTKPESFRSWFHCIVANKCRDWLKKKKPQLFTDMGSEDETVEFEDTLESDKMEFSPEAQVDYQETKRLMDDILQRLPEDQRLCILMYYYEELGVQDIAQALGCSTGTVKSRLNYGRNKIKTEVEDLKKKGVHLYGIAPIPFLVWMLRESANTLSVPDMTSLTALLETSAVEVTTHTASQVVSDGAKEAVSQVAKEGAKHIDASTVRKTITSKVVAGIVGVAVVSGAVIGVPKVTKHLTQEKDTVNISSTNEEKKQKKTKDVEDKDADAVFDTPVSVVCDEKAQEMLCEFADVLRTFYRLHPSGEDKEENFLYEFETEIKDLPDEILKKIVSWSVIVYNQDVIAKRDSPDYDCVNGYISREELVSTLENTYGMTKDMAAMKNIEDIFPMTSEGFEMLFFAGGAWTLEKTLLGFYQTGTDTYRAFVELSELNDGKMIADIELFKNKESITCGYGFDKISFRSEENWRREISSEFETGNKE